MAADQRRIRNIGVVACVVGDLGIAEGLPVAQVGTHHLQEQVRRAVTGRVGRVARPQMSVGRPVPVALVEVDGDHRADGEGGAAGQHSGQPLGSGLIHLADYEVGHRRSVPARRDAAPNLPQPRPGWPPLFRDALPRLNRGTVLERLGPAGRTRGRLASTAARPPGAGARTDPQRPCGANRRLDLGSQIRQRRRAADRRPPAAFCWTGDLARAWPAGPLAVRARASSPCALARGLAARPTGQPV